MECSNVSFQYVVNLIDERAGIVATGNAVEKYIAALNQKPTSNADVVVKSSTLAPSTVATLNDVRQELKLCQDSLQEKERSLQAIQEYLSKVLQLVMEHQPSLLEELSRRK